jgi:hypothetical protein
MKLISFSLYGKDPKYVKGIFRNLELKKEIYSDWKMIVFHDDSVEQTVLDELLSADVILRNVDGCGIFPASWRFLAHDEPNVEMFISRDADSRINKREEEAVLEWQNSDKVLHIMRDHPHHGAFHFGKPILGGMWGLKTYYPNGIKIFNIDFKQWILMHQGEAEYSNLKEKWFWTDMNFLKDTLYYLLGNPKTCMIHAAQDYMNRVEWFNEDFAKDFPSAISQDKHFIGEIFTFDENGVEKREYQYRER